MYAGDLSAPIELRHNYDAIVRGILRRGYVSVNHLEDDEGRQTQIRSGKIILASGRFKFRKVANASKTKGIVGPGQIRNGEVSVSNFTFKFTFDAWEATSASSWQSHLTRTMEMLGVLLVRSIQLDGDVNIVQTTCLAMGNGAAGNHWEPPKGSPPLSDIGAHTDENTTLL
jgi:hypothetical protein